MFVASGPLCVLGAVLYPGWTSLYLVVEVMFPLREYHNGGEYIERHCPPVLAATPEILPEYLYQGPWRETSHTHSPGEIWME